jgi:hypothetical protein
MRQTLFAIGTMQLFDSCRRRKRKNAAQKGTPPSWRHLNPESFLKRNKSTHA